MGVPMANTNLCLAEAQSEDWGRENDSGSPMGSHDTVFWTLGLIWAHLAPHGRPGTVWRLLVAPLGAGTCWHLLGTGQKAQGRPHSRESPQLKGQGCQAEGPQLRKR